MATTYEKIASVTVGSGGAANIEFTSIPQTFQDLILLCSVRNADSGNIYAALRFQCNGTDITGRRLGAEGSPFATYSDTNAFAYMPTNGATASTFNNTSYYIANYASTTTNKSISVDSVSENNGTSSGMDIVAGTYSSNTAVTSVKIYHNTYNLVEHSTAVLYGIKKS